MNALSSVDACKDFLYAFTAAQRGVVIPKAARAPDWDKHCKHVLNYIDKCVDEASVRVAKDEKSDDSKHVRIVDELVRQMGMDDRQSLRYLVLSIFSPSHDTVAVTLSNVFFHLARNAHVWEKLRAEILPTASQPLTYELLNSYKYLRWVVKESMLC
jgi:cytochrome P450